MFDYKLTVDINRTTLLEKLKENKKRYVNSMIALIAAWKELSEKYRKDYQEWEAKYVAETLGKDEEKPEPPQEIEDRTDEYDLYIKMMSLANQATISLDKEDFNQLYLDNWRWMGIHKNTIHAYACSDMSISVNTLNVLKIAANSYDIKL